MISIIKQKKQPVRQARKHILVEIRGLSTDVKPIMCYNDEIDNGSTFIEIDTGKQFMFDYEHQKWLPEEEPEPVKSMNFENNGYTITGSGTIKLISTNFKLSDYDLNISSSGISVITIGNITKNDNEATIEINVESDGQATIYAEIEELKLYTSTNIVANME